MTVEVNAPRGREIPDWSVRPRICLSGYLEKRQSLPSYSVVQSACALVGGC